jgi:hypothetical protein
MRLFIALFAALLFAGCGDHHRDAEARDHHPSKKARVKSEARHVGHKLHTFFRGDD